jgi:hypothetical protein
MISHMIYYLIIPMIHSVPLCLVLTYIQEEAELPYYPLRLFQGHSILIQHAPLYETVSSTVIFTG